MEKNPETKHKNAVQTTNKMPLCSERYLTSLVLLINAISQSEHTDDKTKKTLESEIDHFRQHLQKEGRDDSHSMVILEAAINAAKQQQWRVAAENFERLLKLLRPFNIQEALRLAELTQGTEYTIANQSVILLLGVTGAGKSTTAHFLAGSEMQKQKVKDLTHIAPINSTSNTLHKVTVSAEARSETKHITAIPVNHKGKTFYICDTPGFEDTSGPEVDISNGIGLIKALQKCKQVRLVVILSYSSIGDRMTGLKSIANTLVKMLPDIKSHKKAISYYFTKFPKSEESNIEAMIGNIERNLTPEEKADESFNILLKDLESKSSKGKDCKAIDPLQNGASDNCLKDLVTGKFIEQPDKAFQEFLPEKSMQVLNQQVIKDQTNILRAAEQRNYLYAGYLLRNLKDLSTLLKSDNIRQPYENYVNQVINQLYLQYKEATNTFNHRLKLGNDLTQKDIDSYQGFAKSAEEAEPIREMSTKAEAPCSSSYNQNVKDRAQQLLNNFFTVWKFRDSVNIKAVLNKLKLLSQNFPDDVRQYNQCRQSLADSLSVSDKQLLESLKKLNFEQAANELRSIYVIVTQLKEHVSVIEPYQSYHDKVTQKLNDIAEHAQQCLAKPNISEKDIKTCQTSSEALKNACAFLVIKDIHPYEQIKTIYNHYQQIVHKLFKDRSDEAIALVNNSELAALEKPFRAMKMMATISCIQNKVAIEFQEVINAMNSLLDKIAKAVQSLAKSIINHQCRSQDCLELSQNIKSLKDAEWAQNYQMEFYQKLLVNVKNQISQEAQRLVQQACTRRSQLEPLDWLKAAHEAFVTLENMQSLQVELPYVKDSCERAFEEITKEIIRECNHILIELKSSHFDAERTEQVMAYFEACEQYFPRIDECRKAKEAVWKCVKSYSESIISVVEDSFIIIDNALDTQKFEYKDIKKAAGEIFNRLEEMDQMKTSAPELFKALKHKNYWKDVKQRVSKVQEDIFDKLSSPVLEDQPLQRQNLLQLARALSQLDCCSDGNNLKQMRDEVRDEINQSVKGLGDGAMEDFRNKRFRIGIEKMNNLNSTSCKKAKQALDETIDDEVENLRCAASLLNGKLETQHIEKIAVTTKMLTDAEPIVRDYIRSPESIEQALLCVRASLTTCIKKYLKSCSGLLKYGRFEEAQLKIEHITTVKERLQAAKLSLTSKPRVSQLNSRDNSMEEQKAAQPNSSCEKLLELFQEIDELDQMLEKAVHEKADEYKSKDLNSYAFDPPKALLEYIKGSPNPNTIDVLNNLKKEICNKVQEELKQTTKGEPLNIDAPSVTKVAGIIKYLPEDLAHYFDQELNSCKAEIQKNIEEYNTRLEEVFVSESPNKAFDCLKKFEEVDNKDGQHRIISHVTEKIQALSANVSKHIDINQTNEALKAVKSFMIYHDIFQSKPKLEDCLKGSFDKIKNCLTDYFKTHAEMALKGLNQLSEGEVHMLSTLESSFEILSKFKQEAKLLAIQNKILPENYESEINSLVDKAFILFVRAQNKFSDAIKANEPLVIAHSLQLIKNAKSLPEMLQKEHIDVDKCTTLKSFRQLAESLDREIDKGSQRINDWNVNKTISLKFKTEIDKEFEELSSYLSVIDSCCEKSIAEFIRDPKPISEECHRCLKTKSGELSSIATKSLQEFFSDMWTSQDQAEKFNKCYTCLMSFEQHIKPKFTVRLEDLNTEVIKKVKEYQAKSEGPIENVAEGLINIKAISDNIPHLKAEIDKRLDDQLEQYKNANGGGPAIAKLGLMLNKHRRQTGKNVTAEHKCFEGFSISIFNQKIQKQGIDYVMEKIEGSHLQKTRLRSRYDEYEKVYKDLIEENLKPNIDFDKLISQIKLIAGNIQHQETDICWDGRVQAMIPKLVAHIFALWTLKNSSHYFEASTDKDSYLFVPHAAQIISIFRMIGTGDSSEKLSNNLVQIGTGEGKSLILAATSSVFTLLGFEVSCACYSDYLSQRDYKAFQSLFDALGVTKHIHYGTFNQLCEKVINEHGDIRKVVRDCISSESSDSRLSESPQYRPKILLIDEVDVFFGKDFYGNIYTPASLIEDSTITALLDYIWSQRESPALNYQNLMRHPALINCCQKFSRWNELIGEVVRDLIFDAKSFKPHDYIVNDDRIGYKEQDRIVYNTAFGYKTLFAYYYENERGRISNSSLQQYKAIRIKCGCFSYAEMPKKFHKIFGVTGTLKTLSEAQRSVIQDFYNIKKHTYTPSVFGANDLRFSGGEDVFLEDQKDYFNKIKTEIQCRLSGKLPDTKRAVLVFFESVSKLNDFYESPTFSVMKHNAQILTEEANNQEKDYFVKQATISGKISLLTRTFGRGTDFVCRDDIVATNGGVHVIQTFLSEEVSEEVQIKGRTARQGESGSYSLVLLKNDLEKCGVTEEETHSLARRVGQFWNKLVGKNKSTHDLLNKRRNKVFESKYKDNKEYVKDSERRHLEAQDFLRKLYSGDISAVKAFLCKVNKGPETNSICSRTLCLMDATGSMGGLIHRTKVTVENMFKQAYDILQGRGIGEDSFEVQFAVYRNYNSSEDRILQASTWETKPENLRAFMAGIEVEGGCGREAVEIGLWHANQEAQTKQVSQVILIADMPPNTPTEVVQKRQSKGEQYWSRTKFKSSTTSQQQIDQLKQRGIPIHAFYVTSSAKEEFTRIANSTGGKSDFLDINSDRGATQLTNTVTEQILQNVGQAKGMGDQLVYDYRNKYVKSYT